MDQVQSKLYKTGIFLELHRFKNSERQGRGWDLSLKELRALSTITFLLARTDFKGNKPAEKIVNPKNIRWRRLKEAPVLSFTWKEYLDFYYGSEFTAFTYRGQQATIPKKALALLSKKLLSINYYVKSIKKWMYYSGNIIIDKNKALVSGSRKRNVILVLHPIFIDAIKNFHAFKPIDLFQGIQKYLNKKRVNKANLLFIEWLITKNNNPTVIGEDKLIERLWLKDLQDSRHIARLNATLNECYDTAKGLGYLLDDVKKDGFGNLVFTLNPEKCKRLKKKKKQA